MSPTHSGVHLCGHSRLRTSLAWPSKGLQELMEGSQHHLTSSPRPHAPHLSRFALSAPLITPAADPRTLSIVTATLRSRSPLPGAHRCMRARDSVPCLSRRLSSAIYPTPPRRVTPGFASTRRPTACTVTHSLPRHASPPALIKWPPLPLPIIRVPSWARLPVGHSRTVWVCSAEDSRASCLTLGLCGWPVARREEEPHRSPPTWAEFGTVTKTKKTPWNGCKLLLVRNVLRGLRVRSLFN